MLNKSIVILGLSMPFLAHAETTIIQCGQVTDITSVSQMINVVIDETSDKAEVQLFAHSAECATTDSCGYNIYKKDVLPSVIRLSYDVPSAYVSYTTTIDIDRTTLAVVTKTVLFSDGERRETLARGQCAASKRKGKRVI